MLRDRRIGRWVPEADLAELHDNAVRIVPSRRLLGRGRFVVAGMPGAFIPLCSTRRVPNLLDNVDALEAAGFDRIICIVTSDPFSLAEWAQRVDPDRRLRFMSDGNLDLARGLGVTASDPRHFAGERSMRYLMTVRDGSVEQFRVETSPLGFDCTRVEQLLAHA